MGRYKVNVDSGIDCPPDKDGKSVVAQVHSEVDLPDNFASPLVKSGRLLVVEIPAPKASGKSKDEDK